MSRIFIIKTVDKPLHSNAKGGRKYRAVRNQSTGLWEVNFQGRAFLTIDQRDVAAWELAK